MKKRFYIMALALAMVVSIAGCGKKKDDKETADSTAAIRDDIVEFVDVEFNDIRSDWDEAIADYNTFFEGDMKDSKQFASDLQTTTIPKIDKFITNLDAISVESSEAEYLKSLYKIGAEKQRDAMNMVALAIEEESQEYLEQADALIAEANGYLETYDSELTKLASEYNFTVN